LDGASLVKLCAVCSSPFTARKNLKTCTPECGTVLKQRRERSYIRAHPEVRAVVQLRHVKEMAKVRHGRRRSNRLNRAVRILFALTGETNA
jgi:hypothetical protein